MRSYKEQAHSLTEEQRRWYEAVQGRGDAATKDGKYQDSYTRNNSLDAGASMQILQEYFQAHDPALLDDLRAQVKKTPQRAKTEAAQDASLEHNPIATTLTDMTGRDAREDIKGLPSAVGSHFVPGGPLGKRGRAGKNLARGLGAAGSIGGNMVQTLIENPDADFEDHKKAAVENFIASTGMHAAGGTARVIVGGAAEVLSRPGAAPGTAGQTPPPGASIPDTTTHGQTTQKPGTPRPPGAAPPLGEVLSQQPGGLAGAIASARQLWQQKGGRLGGDKAHVFHSAEELINSDYARQHPFTDQQKAALRNAEGFFDPRTGQTVIIAGNVGLRAGETPQAALTRVLLHERVGHDGLNALLQSSEADGGSPTLIQKRWANLQQHLLLHQRGAIGSIAAEPGYQHLKGNTEALALEWFARQAEARPELLTQPSLVMRMRDNFKDGVVDLMARLGMDPLKGKDLDAQVMDLLKRARQSAVQGGSGPAQGGALGQDLQFSMGGGGDASDQGRNLNHGSNVDENEAGLRHDDSLSSGIEQRHALIASPLRMLDKQSQNTNLTHEQRNPSSIFQELTGNDAGGISTGAGADAQKRRKSGRALVTHSRVVAWARENGREIDPASFGNIGEASFDGEHAAF